jgi:hypothetical protein
MSTLNVTGDNKSALENVYNVNQKCQNYSLSPTVAQIEIFSKIFTKKYIHKTISFDEIHDLLAIF